MVRAADDAAGHTQQVKPQQPLRSDQSESSAHNGQWISVKTEAQIAAQREDKAALARTHSEVVLS